MKSLARTTVALVLLGALANLMPPAHACGPESIDPIFVFKSSPDLPFTEYARGHLGIVRPSFGRKTLVIAYRYLNGGWFSDEEQSALVEALKGTAPEGDGTPAVKAWIDQRQQIAGKEEKPLEIYTERPYSGYDFFPNCAKNAFEVATTTLKDRVATYGAEDPNVRAWLAAQDAVFQNCQGGGALPEELGPASPTWLRKDRDYQIAAALLYSLKFDDARARFEKIASDAESPWQGTAEYLVARTLVRQASLTEDEKKKRPIYDEAEQRLRILAARRTPLAEAAQKLLGLIEYRAHPESRVRELAHSLSHESGDANLKQNLIDYTWLLDKFEDRILKEEEKRKKEAEAAQKADKSEAKTPEQDIQKKYDAVARGDLIQIMLTLKTADEKPDLANMPVLYFKPEVSEAEVIKEFEAKIGRPLLPEEREDLHSAYGLEQKARAERISPNSRFGREALTEHEGCDYYDECERLSLDLLPDFLSADDLTDWTFTVQATDRSAYDHALSKYRATRSTAWLVTALTKASRGAPGLERLMQDAQAIDRNSPAFPTIAYHLIRIKTEQGKSSEARQLSDQILGFQFEHLPVSARNQFLEQRVQLSDNVTDFLRFGQRKPAAFYYDGALGTMHDLARIEKSHWDLDELWRTKGEGPHQTREEYEQAIDDEYKDKLVWDDRVFLDERTVEIINWHFPLADLELAARNPVLPEYTRRSFALAVWTRAIVLQNKEVANRIAPEVAKLAPEMKEVLDPYLNARTDKERQRAALYVLLKYVSLSPFVTTGIPELSSSGDAEFYFESVWWCTPSNTEYNYKEERDVPKVVAEPVFLSAPQLEAAQKERAALIALGDGRSYLGKLAIAWAKESPKDTRIPEALFIAAEANKPYKYGCQAWEGADEIEKEAAAILLNRYPQSPWAAKLAEEARQ